MSRPKWLDDFNPTTADCKAGCCKTGTRQQCFTKFYCRCHRPMQVMPLDVSK